MVAEIAQEKYRSGLVGFNDVLDNQRSLFSYDDQRIASREAITNDIINLYQALGGGWQLINAEAPPRSSSPMGASQKNTRG